MENEYMKRGYLLPGGCKDLSDIPKYKAMPTPQPLAPLPPITGEMTVPAQMTVSELAAALSQNPFRIIADLMGLNIFVTLEHQLDFDLISRVARKYGFTAKRAV
jgi:Translation initiation factor IF-2, N-terminal region